MNRTTKYAERRSELLKEKIGLIGLSNQCDDAIRRIKTLRMSINYTGFNKDIEVLSQLVNEVKEALASE